MHRAHRVMALLLASFASCEAATISHRIVAFPGDAAPGTPGYLFEDVVLPAISPGGEIAFTANVDNAADGGVWLDIDGSKSLTVLEDTASTEQGLDFGFGPGWPNIHDGGRIAVRWGLKAPIDGYDTSAGIFVRRDDGTLQTVAVDGQATPIPGTNFHFGEPNGDQSTIVLTDDFGRVVFSDKLTGTVDGFSDDSLWMYDGTQFVLLAREGDPAPGGGMYSPLVDIYGNPVQPSVRYAALGGDGDLLFVAWVKVDTAIHSALFFRHNGVTQRIAIEYSGFVGLGSNEVIHSMGGGLIAVNRSAQIAFTLEAIDNNTGDRTGVTYLSDPGGTNIRLLHRDATASQTGYDIGVGGLTDRGEVVGYGGYHLANQAGVEMVVSTDSGGTTHPLVAIGDPAPGTSSGETFSYFYNLYANAVGQFAILAELDGSDPQTSTGIWAGSIENGLHLVVRRGDTINGKFVASPNSTQIDSYPGKGGVSFLSDQGNIIWTAPAQSGDALVVSYFGDPPPPPPRLTGLEAVQVVQDLHESENLYIGKPTLVRAYLDSQASQDEHLILRVFDDTGVELPYSPLPVEAPGGVFTARPNGDSMRGLLAASANWTLPPFPAEGHYILKVESTNGSLDCREVAGTPHDCAAQVNVVKPDVPQLRIVALDWLDPKTNQLRVVDRASRQDLVDRLVSQYPIATVSWDDREMFWPESDPKLEDVLPYVRRLRLLDDCNVQNKCLRMYYGVLERDKFEGLGYVDAYAASGFMRPDPHATGRHTASHEIGHNLGRRHAVAGPPTFPLLSDGEKQGACGSKAPGDAPDFPYFNDVAGLGLRPTLGPLGVYANDNDVFYGYDSLQGRIVDPERYFDIMSYCHEPIIDAWPSAYTYDKLAFALYTRYELVPPVKAPTTPQSYVVVSGMIDTLRQTLSNLRVDRATLTTPPDASASGDWEARLLDAGSNPLASTSFALDEVESGVAGFLVALPDPGSVASVEIRDGQANLVASRSASAHAPTVTVLSPNGGETLSTEQVTVTWSSADADGDSLRHAVQFSADGGATWTTLTMDVPGQSASFPRKILPATTQGLFRVIASDGFLQAQDDSDATFTVTNSGPDIHIIAPQDGTLFLTGRNLTLRASAYDTDDGVLGDAAIAWSSNVDGALGTGTMLQLAAASLTPGPHVFTATATDSQSATASATVNVVIATERPATLVDVGLDLTVDDAPKAAFLPHAVDLNVENAGPDAVGDLQASVAFVITPVIGASGNGAMLVGYTAPDGWSCTLGTLTADCTAPTLDALSTAVVSFDLVVDQESTVDGTASFTSSATDSVGANNVANVEYVVGADDVFGNGFD